MARLPASARNVAARCCALLDLRDFEWLGRFPGDNCHWRDFQSRVQEVVNLDGQILWLERASVAGVADNCHGVPIAEQHVRGYENKRVSAMPSRLRIRQHPAHCVNRWLTIIEMQHHWE